MSSANRFFFSNSTRGATVKLCALQAVETCPRRWQSINNQNYSNFTTEKKPLTQLPLVNKQIGNRNISSKHKPSISIDTINPNVKLMEYVVRGPQVLRAAEIERELMQGVKKPFNEVIRANIGDCHAMGQKPITFIRQVLALTLHPSLIDEMDYPSDIKDRARQILSGCKGLSLGSYTDEIGIEFIRRQVAKYIGERDSIPADFNDIVLTSGASPGIKSLLTMFNCTSEGKNAGIMAPIPQYPIYAASIVEQGMHQIGYYLDEDSNWDLNIKELERTIKEARKVSSPRAIVVINPGNPTGQVITRENIEEIIKFAHRENLFIFADEVYQQNVYEKNSEFHAFKKVLMEMGEPYNKMGLASFMSCSKGYMGECGIRGGYMEIINFPADVKAMLFKMLSAQSCPTTIGQALTYCVVNPPKLGEPSYELYAKERKQVLDSLKERAELVHRMFNSFEGFKCNLIQGSMYAYPKITLPQKAIEIAEKEGQTPDVFYTLQLLQRTGICIVPGTGFGQKPGTYHFRTTILPQTEKLKEMLEKFQKFHIEFMEKYK